MKRSNKKKIAVLTSGWSIDYVQSVLEGIRSTAAQYNTDVYAFLSYSYHDQLKILNSTTYKICSLINYKDFDGVIIFANIFENQDVLAEELVKIKKAGIRCVSLLKKLDNFECISSDSRKGFIELLQHTKDIHNCSDYAYIGGPSNNFESDERYETFINFIEKNNLTLKENRVFTNGDYTADFAKKVSNKLFEDINNIPDVVVCINDQSALGVISTAKQKGLEIPKDLKVIGYDNIVLSKSAIPSISTCDAQNALIGKLAVEKILNQENKKTKNPVIPSIPIFRQSCGCNLDFTQEQKDLFMQTINSVDEFEHFNRQIRHIDDLFVLNNDARELLAELSIFFEKHHYFEGPDFSIQLQNEFIDSLIKNDFSFNNGESIGEYVSSIVQIVNHKKVPSCKIESRQIIPPSLFDSKPSLYLVFGLINKESIIGYTVIKDSTKLIDYKRVYQWMRNLCDHFDSFKQKCSYKTLSENYLSLATIDSLSGSLNRLGYKTFAYKLFDYNKSKGNSNVIVFFDINSMKEINDKFGHLQGDFAIKAIAESINNQLPPEWIAIRYGGDEFIVIGDETIKNGEDFCRNFQKDLDKTISSLKLPYNLSASIGLKTFSSDSPESLDQAVNIVDNLMYENKKKFHKNN